ncbi:RING finger protein vilya [Contarinia nasturtii]|uniref:RING finger protein vilya n=1 Tax=Contarinia nasturtii TaxID=265458 RepID=UPI0012D4985B|nr:RING finger protein vilya [Contarinia nasturtii]
MSMKIEHPVVFCNNCIFEAKLFNEPTNRRKIYLAACYHVLCEKCRDKNGGKCMVCNEKVHFIEISRTMPERYRKLFGIFTTEPLENALKFQHSNFRLTKLKFLKMIPYFKQKIAKAKKKAKEIEEKVRKMQIAKKKKDNIRVIIVEFRKDKNEFKKRKRERNQQKHQPPQRDKQEMPAGLSQRNNRLKPTQRLRFEMPPPQRHDQLKPTQRPRFEMPPPQRYDHHGGERTNRYDLNRNINDDSMYGEKTLSFSNI